MRISGTLAFLAFPLSIPSAWAAGAPTASDASVVAREDTRLGVVLAATDPDGLALTYVVDTASARTRGTVSCAVKNCLYTPPSNYTGTDQFYFRASNGVSVSNRATVSITVTAVNDAPTASASSGTLVVEDRTRTVPLTASDPDGDALLYQIVSAPSHGSASISGASATYVPSGNYNGADSFTFRVYDGRAFSSAATVSLTVSAVNDAPSVSDVAVSFDEDHPSVFSLLAVDPDGDPLTVEFSGAALTGSTYTTTSAVHGTFTVAGTEVTYVPPANYHGDDSFRYRVSDGARLSAWATVNLHIASVNDTPEISAYWARAANGQPAHVALSGSDIDGDSLSFSVISSPRRGTVTLWNGNQLTYRPTNPNLRGRDSFTYQVSDGAATAAQTVTIDVVPDVARFPLDSLPVDSTVSTSVTADGYVVMQLPTSGDTCQKTLAAQPTLEGSLAGASVGTVALVAGHYDTLGCGYAGYAAEDSSLYVIANTGTPGDFEARLLDDGLNVEASGVALDDGSLVFTKVGGSDRGGGLVRFTHGGVTDNTTVTGTVYNTEDVGSDSSPLFDPASGVTLIATTNVPETCLDASGNECGSLSSVDIYGNRLDLLDEDDGHHAWGSGSCIRVADDVFCGFGPGSDASGADPQDLDACTIVKLGGVPTPPTTSTGTVSTTLSVLASVDPGDPGCTPVSSDLESSVISGGLVSDGTYLYALPLGSDASDATTRVYQYDLDLVEVQVFEIPADYSHTFTNGFHNTLVIAENGHLYTTGAVEIGGIPHYAVVDLDPADGSVDMLVSEPISYDNLYGVPRLFVNAAGDEVIVYTVGATAVVTRLSDAATLDAFPLGSTTGDYNAPAVMIEDGRGAEDGLLFVASDNVVTIVPDSGLYEDTGAPWAGLRRDSRMTGTIE